MKFTGISFKQDHSLPDDWQTNIDGLKMTVELAANGAYILTLRMEKPPTNGKDVSIKLLFENNYAHADRLFLNGFQSWSATREYGIDERIPDLAPLFSSISLPYGDYSIVKRRPGAGLHGFNYTYVKSADKKLCFLGSLNENDGYTIFRHLPETNQLIVEKDWAGKRISEPTVVFRLYFEPKANNLDGYFEALGLPPVKATPCTGWTSWYNYYTNINQAIIEENLNAFASRKLPIDVFQIDDGWQPAVGDWLTTNAKFPQGLKPIADKIHANGYRAGLWIAPFVCEPKSEIFKTHKDWLLTDESGRPVRAGFNPGWGGWLKPYFYALDFSMPAVRDYVARVFDRALNDWGFDLLKLDFLYAVALKPNNGKCRGEIMAEAMQFLRQMAGEKQLLGCGVPLASAYGQVDYCRIGCDVGLNWHYNSLSLLNNREFISTRNAIHDALCRWPLNGRAFGNDPDVFILRKENNQLNADQKFTLLLTNLITGNLVFTSDNLNRYDAPTLDLFTDIFPFQHKQIENVEFDSNVYSVRFKIGVYDYLAVINVSGRTVNYRLGFNHYFDCLEQRLRDPMIEKVQPRLKPYQSRCFLVVPNDRTAIAGAGRKLFSGSEIEKFEIDDNGNLTLVKNPLYQKPTVVRIRVPDRSQILRFNGSDYQPDTKGMVMIKLD